MMMSDTSKAGGVRELTGRVVNGQVQLFAVTGFGVGAQPNPGGSVIEVTDTGADAGFTTLATDPISSKSELTGVAFTPTQTVSSSVLVLAKVTNQVGLSESGPVYNRTAKTSTIGLTVTNTSKATLTGPFQIVLGSLTSGVSLSSASVTINGKTTNLAISTDGAGHIIITVPASVAASLAPGKSLPAIALVFSNPTDERFNFTSDIYSDPL